MATITTNTFLDGGIARTAGETWAMNGGILTIRTDTRWHANAPAAMTGSIGLTTTSATLGGGVLIDSTAVRWMPYDTGAGNVPAIGTTITQGAVSGYLLGVWSSYTSAPTAVGAAMPVSGYIKFREVTGGAFTTGALVGIGANATAADRQGWIEVVQRQSTANTVPRLGFYRTRGGWFELDQVTSGAANDVIQIPTNGGGAGTHVPAIWIETGVGTNVYECYPALFVQFNSTNLGTDVRSKFVQSIGSGQVRIGYDGSGNAGYVPPAGCRIRIPSNIGRQSTSAGGDANNQVPAATLGTRPDFTTTTGGLIDFEYFMNDWYHVFTSAFQVIIKHTATFDIHTSSNHAAAIELLDYHTGMYNGTSISLTLTSCFLGGTVDDCKFYRATAASNSHSCALTTCTDLILNNCEFGVVQYARSTGRSLSLSQCIGIIINNCFQTNAYAQIATSFGTRINDHDHTDRFNGVTNGTTGIYGIAVLTSSDDTIVDGLTFGKGGTILNVNPYLSPFYSINSSNTTFRNAGTRTAPLNVQAGFAPQYAAQDAGVNSNLKFQRIYLAATRTSAYLTANTSKNVTIESVSGTVGSLQTLALDTQVKGVRATSNSVSGGASVYGTHWFDMFDSDTVGRVWLAFNEPTTFSASQYEAVSLGTGAGFTSAGQIVMPNLGDQIIFTMPYYALGHTAFQNAAATLTGTNTGNFTYEYDIDVNDGNGFTGSYQTLNGANLSAETIDPALGFKLKFRITVATAATTNALTYIRILTNSTAIAQDNLYPLDTANPTLTLTGLEIGTEVVVLNSDYSQELDREVLTGTTFTYNYEWISDEGNFNVNILIWKDDKIPFVTTITLADVNQSIPLTQSEDLVYDSGYTNTHTIDFANELIILDSGEYDVQQVYSLWKDEILLTTNAQYDFAFTQVGGNTVGGSNSIPFYTFLSNGWKVRPQEANATTNVVNGILVTDDDSDPFTNTLGAYTVRINYQQPVQAIAVATGGGGGATAAQVWSYATRDLTSGGVSAIQSGLATSAEIAALNDISVSDVVSGMQAVANDFKADVSGLATQASVDIIDGIVDAILVDTNELQTNQGNWLTATGFSTPTNITDAQSAVQADIAALNNIGTSDVNTQVTNALTSANVLTDSDLNKIADTTLKRATSNIEASSDGDALSLRSLYGMIAQGVHKTSIAANTLTVTQSDDSTTLGTRTITTDANAEPITGLDTD